MRPFPSIPLIVGILAAGCLAGDPVPSVPPLAPETLQERLDAAAAGQDRSLLAERVRAREVDIVTDPANPLHAVATMMVATPTQYALAPYDAMAWSGLALSEDGGRSWTYRPFSGYPGDPEAAESPYAGAIVVGDPVVRFDRDGGFYLGFIVGYPPLFLTMMVAKHAWGSFEPEYVSVLSRGALGVEGLHEVPTTQPFMHVDKEQILVDPGSDEVYAAWSDRLQAASRSQVVFAKSADRGRSWSDPVPIARPEPHYLAAGEHQIGAWPILTAEGNLAVFWLDWADQGKLWVSHSADRGESFEPPLLIDAQPGPWLPAVRVDLTGGPEHGAIYVVASDRRAGQSDTYLYVSRDHGRTWTAGLRVNPDGVGNVRMPNVAVGPDGTVGVVYMADAGDASAVHAYLAVSVDGGASFATTRLTREPTDPVAINNQPAFLTHLGDYIGIAGTDAGFLAAWQDGRASTPSVPYSEIWSSAVRLPSA